MSAIDPRVTRARRRTTARWHWCLSAGVVVALALSGIAGPSPAAPSAHDAPSPPLAAVPAGWTVHAGSDGLLVRHPSGWQVQERGNGAFAVVEPGTGVTPSSIALVQPLQRIDGRATGVAAYVGTLAPDLFPSASHGAAQTISEQPEVAVATFTFSRGGERFQGRSLCFRDGQRGVLYAIATREPLLASRLPVLKQILTGFVYSSPVAGTSSNTRMAVPEMITWTEPNEGAFALPVARGWRVAGGLRRVSNVEVRFEVVVESPDEGILIRFGDAQLPAMMVTPSPTTAMAAPEGTTYLLQDGQTTSMILRYLPGYRFLTDYYLPMRLGAVNILEANDLSEVSRTTLAAISPIFAAQGAIGRVDTGEVRFDFDSAAGPRKGYALCQTQGSAGLASLGSGAADWVVSMLVGYVAAPGNEALARVVMQQMTEGFRENPTWRHRQNMLAAQTSGIVSNATAEMSDTMYRSWAENNRRKDTMIQDYDRRVVRGEVTIRDPTTGRRYDVEGGSNYYWRVGPGDHFVGTEFNVDAPGYWVDRMELLP